MAEKALFSILTLPQKYDNGTLWFNIVFVPRNISPLKDLSYWLVQRLPNLQNIPKVGPFADAGNNFKLEAKIISGLNSLPSIGHVSINRPLSNIRFPDSVRDIYVYLQTVFHIDDIPSREQKAPLLDPNKVKGIKKYLPYSYRGAFNFTNPRTKDAVIDDSYHCSFKDTGVKPFIQSGNRISWGKVYAYCLRNPEIAKKVGLIFADISIPVPKDTFEDGGWLFVDYPKQPTKHYYKDIQDHGFLTKRYAARIPAMESEEKRILFAPVLFPVAYDADLSGNYDNPQREAADYDDGFAKIIHSFQPISTSYLQEEPSEEMLLPTKDIGIRLAWDDEQVLIWQNRQLKPDGNNGQSRLDAPLGVFNYRIDVREKQDGNNPWHSLNRVAPKHDLLLGKQQIMRAGTEIELGTEIYPMQNGSDQNEVFWLPMYFTQWSGKSLVVPDEDAHAIYQIEKEERKYLNGEGFEQNLKVQLSKQYSPIGLENIKLEYGKIYEFRVRMGDISGGGPTYADRRIFESISQDNSIHFKRNIAPNAVRMKGLPVNNDFFDGEVLELRRPLLDYPNVEFTSKYEDVVKKLISYSKIEYSDYKKRTNIPLGLPDPDINEVEIIVEIKSLQMDNQLSVSGREPYIKLYSVTRQFEALDFLAPIDDTKDVDDPFKNIEDPLKVPLEYREAPVLKFGDPADLGDLGISQDELQALDKIILPTARDIRITLKALGNNDGNYYGLDAWEKGKTIQFMVRKASNDERLLYDGRFDADRIEGIYLQPDLVSTPSGQSVLLGRSQDKPSTLIQRLAQQIDVENRGLSLVARKGVRVQFGCSRRIRHSISPDGTSLTFSTRTDFLNHWLVPIHLRLRRDWTWDGTHLEGFSIKRRIKFGRANEWSEKEEVGTIDIHKTINLQALQEPNRSFAQLIFIDAVEPKANPDINPYPDILNIKYTVETNFKDIGLLKFGEELIELSIDLPVTTNPAQEPQLVSAGIALSPYRRDKRYANTEPRRRFLWIELEEPVQDPNDAVFIRLLASAPDPLLTDLLRNPELLIAPDEPALPVDPELIRAIRPDQVDDDAGLNAMTELVPSNVKRGEKPRHFIVPLPPGLHPESDELFGFFTYELRIGHRKIWSTAQGRFGRPLRVTGVQHPAPTLFCTAERTEGDIIITAPYATSVHKGKNVTAKPPRTELWCLIYARVKLADDQDFRNILLGEDKLSVQVKIPKWDFASRTAFLDKSENEDAKVYGSARIEQSRITNALASLGLPSNSPLSFLCVEFLPSGYNYNEPNRQVRIPKFDLYPMIAVRSPAKFTFIQEELSFDNEDVVLPLSAHLGDYRILRTSPLIEVPEICCEDCH